LIVYISANIFISANMCDREVRAVFHNEEAELNMKKDKVYSRQQMILLLQEDSPGYSSGSYQWKLGEMLKSGEIVKTGYDQYKIPAGKTSPVYLPEYSELAATIMNQVSEKYPYIAFTVFETVLLNEFLNHLVAQNTIFVQAEKEISSFVFRSLQEEGYENVMLKPAKKDFDLYWTKNAIVVTDLVSEAPMQTSDPHKITMEKMLVDIYCDKLIKGTFSRAEYPSIVEQAFDKYMVDRTRMLRYARRRNKETEIAHALDTGLN